MRTKLIIAGWLILFCCVGFSGAAEPKSLFDGKSLDGWRIANKHAYQFPGDVAVKDGAIVLPQGRMATGVVCTQEIPTMNYEVSLEARRTAGSDFFCGITFPIDKKHCTLICGGWGGGTTGLSNVDGFSADENETTSYTEFEEGRWYTIRLRVTREKIQVWVDDKQIVDLKLKGQRFNVWWEQEPMRPFGIGNWYTSSELRNITLTKLDQEKD